MSEQTPAKTPHPTSRLAPRQAVSAVRGLSPRRVMHTLRFGSIRTRLLVAFIALTILPVAIGGIVNTVAIAANSRQKVLNQLEAVVALKEEQINLWLNQLKLDAGDLVNLDQTTRSLPQLLQSDPSSSEFATASNKLLAQFERAIQYRHNYASFSVITPAGKVLMSSDASEMQRDYGHAAGLTAGLQQTYIAPPVFDPLVSGFRLDVYTPILDQDNKPIGILVGRADMNLLNQIMSKSAGLGDTGETYLALADGTALTATRYRQPFNNVRSPILTTAGTLQTAGSDVYASYHIAPVYGAWRWMPDLQAALVSEQVQAEAEQATALMRNLTALVAAISIAVAIAAALFIARGIARPIEQLEQVTRKVMAGQLQERAVVAREDEVGALANTFNKMADQLQSLIGELEERVQARTEQLRASAEVGRTAVSVLAPDQLMDDVVNLIAERFGFYYVAIFTLDKAEQYAVLRSATGEAGQILKEQRHRLQVGGQSMVGFVTSRRRARIAMDVGEEAVRFANPLLPATRSEIALPLVLGDRMLGALDVQSTAEAAFDETSAVLLQSMADQIAIALNNALSFAESETIVRRSRALLAVSRQVNEVRTDLKSLVDKMLYAAQEGLRIERWWIVTFDTERANLVPLSTAAWPAADNPISIQEQPSHLWVRSAVHGEQFIVNEPTTDMRLEYLPLEQRRDLGKFMVVPIVERDISIGALAYGRNSKSQDFTAGDLEAISALASLLAMALENHHLYQTDQQVRSELDQLYRRVTGESWTTFTRKRDRSGVLWFSTGEDYAALPEVGEALRQGHVATRPLSSPNQLGVAVPIVLRDTPLGAFRLVVPRQRWNEEMLTSLEAIAGHVAQAAENVRLLSETEERFAREKAVASAADKIHRSTEIEGVLRTAVTELNRMMGNRGISIQLGFGSTANSTQRPPHGAVTPNDAVTAAAGNGQTARSEGGQSHA